VNIGRFFRGQQKRTKYVATFQRNDGPIQSTEWKGQKGVPAQRQSGDHRPFKIEGRRSAGKFLESSREGILAAKSAILRQSTHIQMSLNLND
jgi:hypothetical protein